MKYEYKTIIFFYYVRRWNGIRHFEQNRQSQMETGTLKLNKCGNLVSSNIIKAERICEAEFQTYWNNKLQFPEAE